MNKLWPLLLTTVILTGCEDPYPSQEVQDNLSVNAPAQERKVRSGFGTNFEGRTFDFTEGNTDEYFISAVVPSGRAVITFTDLPAGATFVRGENKISWQPGFDFVNVSIMDNKLQEVATTIPVKMRIHSTDNPGIREEFTGFFRVRNFRNPTEIQIGATQWSELDVNEGDTETQRITITSVDFPDGPYQLTISPQIQGLTFTPVSNVPNQYDLTFAPGFDAIKIQDCVFNFGCERSENVTFSVRGPDGFTVSTSKTITYNDVRKTPEVSFPENLTIGLNGSIQFVATDPNNEVAPTIELTSMKPEHGEFTFTTEDFDAISKSTVATIDWKDIPLTYNNQIERLSFRICNYDHGDFESDGSISGITNCIDKSVNITITNNQRPAPQIVREDWPLNDKKIFLVGETYSQDLKFTLGENEDIASVDLILPPLITDGSGTNPTQNLVELGTLDGEFSVDITALAPGPYQFSVRVTSSYGVQTSEAFIFEVLPADWSTTLVLGNSVRDQENVNLQSHIADFDFVNPFNTPLVYPITERRETAVIGTAALKEMNEDEFTNVFRTFKNVVIASPVLAQLPTSVLSMFSVMSVEPLNQRYQDLTGATDITTEKLVAKRGVLTSAAVQPSFKGNSTTESMNPQTLFVGSDSPCETAMFIRLGQQELPLATVCNNTRGGKWIIVGTEWGDLKMDASELQLPATWFNELLNLEIDND